MLKLNVLPVESLETLSLEEKIKFIAKTSEAIVESPEKNIHQMHSLFRLLKDSNFLVIKLTAISLGEVFKDIVPLYQIDRKEVEEKLKQMLKKDERKVVAFELELLNFYEKFFHAMHEVKQSLSLLIRSDSAKRQNTRRHLPAVQHRACFRVHRHPR
jgi:nucleolar complex protein 3